MINMRLHRPVLRGRLGAWTFVETLIVIGIVLILTSAVGFMAFKYLDQAKVVTAKSQIETLSLALTAYFFDVKELPDPAQSLKALWEKPSDADGWRGPYIAKAVPKDPWGNDYQFKIPGPNGLPFEIISLGADGAPGGSDGNADISSAQ